MNYDRDDETDRDSGGYQATLLALTRLVSTYTLLPGGLYACNGEPVVSREHPQASSCVLANDSAEDLLVSDALDLSEIIAALTGDFAPAPVEARHNYWDEQSDR